eukprot:c23149_g1_i1 orf=273-1355(-)
MGKYIRKGKGVGEVAVMEVSQASLGVRTRARALALERDRKLAHGRPGGFRLQHYACDDPRQTSYLELRSRRLEKVVCTIATEESSQQGGVQIAVSEGRHSQVSSEMLDDGSSRLMLSEEARPNLSQLVSNAASEGSYQQFEGRRPLGSLDASLQSSLKGAVNASLFPSNSVVQRGVQPTSASISRSNSLSISREQPGGILTRNQRKLEKRTVIRSNDMEVDTGVVSMRGCVEPLPSDSRNMEVEASFGENPMEHDGLSARDSQMSHGRASSRRIRESTPSSYIRDIDAPGSATRPAPLRRASQGRSASAPPSGRLPDAEIEAFFSGVEQQEHLRFAARYNFDPVHDLPLPGRYEWVSMQP